MSDADGAVLGSASRVAAARRARRVLPGLSIPLDGIARLAARLLDTPTGLVTVVGGARDDFLGAHGLPEQFLGRRAARDYSLCRHVVAADHPVAVDDMTTDRTLRTHRLVAEHGVRAFAGVPLRDTRDRPVGALTVVDTRPRHWTDQEQSTLVEIAALIGPIPADDPVDTAMAALAEPATAATSTADDTADGTADRTADRTADGIAADGGVNAAVRSEVRGGFITALLDAVQVGVLAVDSSGRPVLFNRILRHIDPRLDDATPEQALAMVQQRLYHLDGQPVAPDDTAAARALRGEHVRDFRTVVRTPDRPDRYLLTNSAPILAADGQRLGAVSTISDITDRLRAERLRDGELAIARILADADTLDQAAPELVEHLGEVLGWSFTSLWLVDPVNPDTLRQVARWSAPGVDLDDLIPDVIPRDLAGLAELVETGTSLWLPDLTRTPQQQSEPLRVFTTACAGRGLRTAMLAAIDPGGGAGGDGGTPGLIACLTSRAEDDEFLVAGLLDAVAEQIGHFLTRHHASDLAGQLAHAKDDFVALAGHAIRTPLTSIFSYTELLLEDPTLTADSRELVEVISRNAIGLNTVVVGLLDLAALETGEDPLRSTDVDLPALVTAALDAVGPAAAASGVHLHTTTPPTLTVPGDPRRLRQVVDNLLYNAIKYSPHGGDVHLTLTAAPTTVELTVTDHGIGVPAAERHRLFRRFYRASNAAHTSIPGTGLGLTLASAIVDAHHGTITIHNPNTGGTTITVHLPRPTATGD
ncbi:sensor histidine kinase [Virgisporangium aurantiacum]|nr:ATP-binding protein [Virgisporangium aurantiacum]